MSTLYELTGQMLMLQQMIEEGEDPDVVRDTMEGIDYEIEIKADGYAKIMRNISADIDGLDKEIARLQAKKSSLERNVKNLKENLQRSMEMIGKEKFKTKLFSFGIQNNPPKIVLDTDVYNVPEDFLIYQEPKVNNTKAKEYLKDHEAGWGHIEQGRSLRIR